MLRKKWPLQWPRAYFNSTHTLSASQAYHSSCSIDYDALLQEVHYKRSEEKEPVLDKASSLPANVGSRFHPFYRPRRPLGRVEEQLYSVFGP
jgi:hypothetical protein